jgi:ssDNA-binding Zn-finger/Zn-ribbon topoisomerase 1
MTGYLVKWEIDIEADSPKEAAEKALAIHRRTDSIATVFEVIERKSHEVTQVDLNPEWGDGIGEIAVNAAGVLPVYLVKYAEGQCPPGYFMCRASDRAHAIEQCRDAHPDAKAVGVTYEPVVFAPLSALAPADHDDGEYERPPFENGDGEFVNFYRCPECNHEWEDQWSSTCEDDCPKCGKRHIEPYKSEDV